MQKQFTRICAALALLFLSSCAKKPITAHMDYLSKRTLASYHVKTPDPTLNDPPMGQRLFITWHLPRACFESFDTFTLKLTVRFCNREEMIKPLILCKRSGVYTYTLINEEYFATCGIQTYKVEIFADGELLHEWHHQLFTELIELNPFPPPG